MTTAGRALDGTAGACVPASEALPSTEFTVRFGSATILLIGHDSGGTDVPRHLDIFVGAGTSNPTLQYAVATVFDAGI